VIKTSAAIAKQRTSIFNRPPSPSTDQRKPTASYSQAHCSCPTHSAKVTRKTSSAAGLQQQQQL